MTAHWYVLHSKPMKEALLWEQLSLQGIESYYPCISHSSRQCPCSQDEALFPRLCLWICGSGTNQPVHSAMDAGRGGHRFL